MQITLETVEIEMAVKAYVKEQGLNFGGAEPTVTLTAGRGPTGITASIEIPKIKTLGSGVIEILDKPVEDTEPFKAETSDTATPAVKKPAAKAKPAAKKTAPKRAAVKKPEEVEPTKEIEEPVEEEIAVGSDTGLFGSSEGSEETTGDSLFGTV